MTVDKLFTILKKIILLLIIIIAFACNKDKLDTTVPEITILGDNPLTITLPNTYTEPGATALDDTDGDISDDIEITNTADFLVPGTYQVTYSVSDAAQNSTSVTREVIILTEPDTTAPEITILGDNPLTITLPTEYTELGATALDDTDGDISNRIEITSTADFLVPGTYQVTYNVSDAAQNSTSVTREVIIEESPLVFVQMADTQIGMVDYQKELDNFSKAVDSINVLKPDFVTICGDLVNHAGEEVYNDFLEIKNGLEVPIYLVAGNHDVSSTPNESHLEFYRNKIGSDYYDFKVKGYNFVVTNTQLWDEGPDYEQVNHRKWFEETMQSIPNNSSFVLGHYQIFTKSLAEGEPTTGIRVSRRQYILDILDEKNTIAYLSGHAHVDLYNEYNGVKLVGARSSGNAFGDGIEGYNVWTVSKDSVSYELVTINN